jgi:hypothetical protein
MTKRSRPTRQQPARRRPQPRPGTPGGATPGTPGGGIGDSGTGAGQETVLNGGSSVDEAQAPARPAAGPAARRVGRLDPASAAGRKAVRQQRQQATFAPLDPEDPAIPFDRVPYVPGDLRRVAIMAGFMVLLIIVAALVVTHTVG